MVGFSEILQFEPRNPRKLKEKRTSALSLPSAVSRADAARSRDAVVSTVGSFEKTWGTPAVRRTTLRHSELFPQSKTLFVRLHTAVSNDVWVTPISVYAAEGVLNQILTITVFLCPLF